MTYPSEDQPLKRAYWLPVSSVDQLVDGDVVRLSASDLGVMYKVRVEELRNGHGTGARFKDIEDWSTNIHYYAGAKSLVEAGVISRRCLAVVNEYDVWATEQIAWVYRPGNADGMPWYQIVPNTAWIDEIDENAVLVWRRGQESEQTVEE